MSMLDGEAGGKRPSKAVLWGLTRTTPGMIAMIAVVVRFLVKIFIFP